MRPLLLVLILSSLIWIATTATAPAQPPPPPPPPQPPASPPLLTFFGPLRLGADPAADDRTLSALGTWLRLGQAKEAGRVAPSSSPGPLLAWPAPPTIHPATPNVIFFSDDDGRTCALLDKLGWWGDGNGAPTAPYLTPHVRCVTSCVHAAFPRLNLSCVVEQAAHFVRTPLLALINSDIALGDDFMAAAERVFFGVEGVGGGSGTGNSSSRPYPPPPPSNLLMVGRRTDVQLGGRLDFADPAWYAALAARAAAKGAMHGSYGIDYLVTAAAGFWNGGGRAEEGGRVGLERVGGAGGGDGRTQAAHPPPTPTPRPPALTMPPFLVGVYRWDSYVMATAIADPAVCVVDATGAVAAFHLQGGAAGAGGAGGGGDHASRPGSVHNDRLVRRLMDTRYLAGRTEGADYELVRRARGGEGVWMVARE